MKSEVFKEWIKPIILGLIIAGITWALREFGGNMEIKKHIISFIITFSPIIIGFFVFFLYRIVADYIKLRRFSNDIIKWIGRFSYQDTKGGYSDLKGKIKRYIQEELEKESADRKAVDTQIAETFSEQIANIRFRIKDIPTKAISDDKLSIK